jgi:small subunit ribosomal protein S18
MNQQKAAKETEAVAHNPASTMALPHSTATTTGRLTTSPRTTVAEYCRFKKNGIKYVDYKDPNFLLKFVNEQAALCRLTGTSLSKFQRSDPG